MPSLSLASVGAEGCCITPGSGFFKLNENVFFLLFLPELYYTAKIPLGMQTESLEITHIAHSSYSSLTRSWKGPLLQRWRICIFKSVSKYWRMAGHRAGISHILYWGFAQKLRLRRKHIRLPPACFQVQLPTILRIMSHCFTSTKKHTAGYLLTLDMQIPETAKSKTRSMPSKSQEPWVVAELQPWKVS